VSINVSNIQSFTDEELLKLYRWALATGSAGTTRTISGRSIQFPDVKAIRETIQWLESRIQVSTTGDGGDIALGEFGEAQ